ncbi:TIGR02594 family protein [Cronobacter turicensis]
MSKDPAWIEEASKHLGLREIKGPQHNAEILQFWRDIKRSGIKDDETPWCAAFVGAMLERSGIRSTRFESAKSYLEWGETLNEARYGCIVVFNRSGGGHVGFVVGETSAGELRVLGGNQSDAVNIQAFPLERVAGYRWPTGQPVDSRPLPVAAASHSSSVT